MKINLSYIKPIKVPKYESDSLVDIPDKSNVRDMISLLEIPSNLVQSILVHVNGEPSWNSRILKEGDSVKLFISFGGG